MAKTTVQLHTEYHFEHVDADGSPCHFCKEEIFLSAYELVIDVLCGKYNLTTLPRKKFCPSCRSVLGESLDRMEKNNG